MIALGIIALLFIGYAAGVIHSGYTIRAMRTEHESELKDWRDYATQLANERQRFNREDPADWWKKET